jgi:predicted metalloprotease with PDZ domain
MKILKILIACLLLCTRLSAQERTDQYQYNIDLLHMQDDKVSVSFVPPGNKLKTGIFVMPKLVPGYYDAMNFGQYVSDFQAFDKYGKSIAVSKLDTNTWKVMDLAHTVRVSYRVTGGWDQILQNTGGAKSPASMFRKDSVSIINYNALTGYFQELKHAGYKITIKKNNGFYASSALKYNPKNDTTDVVTAVDYRHLVDAPVLYCVPDTTWLKVGDTRVLVSFYSAGQQAFSQILAGKLKSILENQMAYLGGKLPVKEYAFLIYHEAITRNGLLGDGLEHSHSTVCLYGSKTLDRLPQALMGVASHEFFHILTPLNIHSAEIQNFDFLNPVLSRHLWLYEGMTEYATIHMPIKQHMISLEEFVKSINEKVKGMAAFDNGLSMTQMSTQAVKRQDQYMNFYQKGALVGLCLDIRLRELSQGKSGTQELMLALMKKYGPERSFKDDELFDVITSMTYPEIREFFRDYVENGQPIPLEESLEKVGFLYDSKTGTVTLNSSPSLGQLLLRKSWIGQ